MRLHMGLTLPSGPELAAVAQRRSQAYWMLARCFGERPSKPLFAELQLALAGVAPPAPDEPLAAESAALVNALLSAAQDETQAQDLSIEFTRLFSGISKSYGGPPPFESVAREGAWGGDTLAAVVEAYAEAGISPPLPEAAPPDHLSAELRFLAIACYHEGQAWDGGDLQAACDWLQRERDFLDQHILCWVPDYCAKLDDLAHKPLYHALLVLTPLACQNDRQDIDNILDAVSSNPDDD